MPKDDQVSASSTSSPAFTGFDVPRSNSFRLPLEWIDICSEIDNLAELKVVQYVLRHTWGFQEYGIKRRLTVDEFMYGRKRKDGSRMDKGTGLSERSVYYGLKSARDHGYLEEDRDETDRARVKKSYSLKMRSGVESSEDTDPAEETGLQGLQPGVQILHPDPAKSAPRTEEPTLEPTLKQQQGTSVPSAPPKVDPQPGGSDVVDSRLDEPRQSADKPEAALTPEQLTEALIKRGVGAGTAAVLVRDPDTRRLIPEKLQLFDWAKQHRPSLITKSDGGWLRMAITTNYPLPADFTTNYPLPADFTAGDEREKQRQLEAEQREQEWLAGLEQQAREMARHPAEWAEQQLRVNDRLQDGLRRPRLVGEERAVFLRTQGARRRAVAAQWFAETPVCAHLRPDWLNDLPDDEGVVPEPSWKAPGSFSRGSDGSLRSIGQVLADRPVTAQIRSPQGRSAKARS